MPFAPPTPSYPNDGKLMRGNQWVRGAISPWGRRFHAESRACEAGLTSKLGQAMVMGGWRGHVEMVMQGSRQGSCPNNAKPASRPTVLCTMYSVLGYALLRTAVAIR